MERRHHNFEGALVRMVGYWHHLPDTKDIESPVEFTEAALSDFLEQKQLWFELNNLLNHWREELGGVSEQGWVSSERYETAVRRAGELKRWLVDAAEGDEEDLKLLETGWPFRDREEDD